MSKLEDIFSGYVELTASERAYVAAALQEFYMSGKWQTFPHAGGGSFLVRNALAKVIGVLKLTQMVTPDGKSRVSPEEHDRLYAGGDKSSKDGID